MSRHAHWSPNGQTTTTYTCLSSDGRILED